ncbi:hypothetical protein [Sarcina ventriculi]
MININGKINIYIRKENKLENLKTGYGRLQWLKYELEDNKEIVNIFVDEYKKCSKMIELIKEIQEGSIDNLLIWSIDDIDKDYVAELANVITKYEIPIISFCESSSWINHVINKSIKVA